MNENSYTKIELPSSHKSAIYVVKFSNDGEHCLSGGQDRTIKLWNPYKKLLINSYNNTHSHDVLDLAITKDNSRIASVGLEKQAFLTDSITGEVLRRFNGHTERINSVCFNPSESVLITGSYDCTVRIYDMKSHNRESIQTLREARDSISKVFSTNDKIITASVDGSVRTYDIRMGELRVDKFHTALNGLDISLDEKIGLVSGLDDNIRLFDLESGKLIKVYNGLHTSRNYTMTLRFTLEQESFFTTSENNNIVLYDILNRSNIEFKGHTRITSGLDVHPTNKDVFISAGYDSKIILWTINK